MKYNLKNESLYLKYIRGVVERRPGSQPLPHRREREKNKEKKMIIAKIRQKKEQMGETLLWI